METTFLRKILFSYAFYSKFATFKDFGKNHLCCQKRHKFRNFWEILPFESHFMASLLSFADKRTIFGIVILGLYLLDTGVGTLSIGKDRNQNVCFDRMVFFLFRYERKKYLRLLTYTLIAWLIFEVCRKSKCGLRILRMKFAIIWMQYFSQNST